MARRADHLSPVVVIDDEFSLLPDEDYDRAVASWLAELGASPSLDLPVHAADTLRELREHGET